MQQTTVTYAPNALFIPLSLISSENMSDKHDDLNLPNAVVTRIIKDALPENCNVAKEAKSALSRAATVFVLYLTAQANNVATERNRKTITNKDVIEALHLSEFGRFEQPLTDALEQFRQMQQSKKEKKAGKDEAKESGDDSKIDEEGQGEVEGEIEIEGDVDVEDVEMQDTDTTS